MHVHEPLRPHRILWIANVFPPVGGGQGRRMRRYLEEIVSAHPETVIDVLTIHPDATIPWRDEVLGGALPATVRVDRVPPGLLHHLRYRLRLDALTLSLPESWRRRALLGVICLSNVAWIAPAAIQLWRQRRSDYTSVYVFVDPFVSVALALLARRLHPAARIVLEYGDPRIPGKAGSHPLVRAGAWLERRALIRSHAAVFRAQDVIELYRNQFPSVPADRYHIVYGGVNWEDYDKVPCAAGQEEFRIVYSGTIYADSVDPAPFIRAIHKVIRDGYKVSVTMIGSPDRSVVQLAEDLALGTAITFLGHIPVDELPAIQRSAALLLAFGFDSPYKISNKLAEYVAARVPILFITASASEPGARLVRDARRGIVVSNDVTDIADSIESACDLWEQGALSEQFDMGRSGAFGWAEGASKIFILLHGDERSQVPSGR
jgi:Glycosyl transferases group 1